MAVKTAFLKKLKTISNDAFYLFFQIIIMMKDVNQVMKKRKN